MILGMLRAMALTGGEWVIYVLILCSVAAIAIMIERGIVFSRERKDLKAASGAFAGYLEDRDAAKALKALEGLSGCAARVLSAGLSRAGQGSGPAESAMAASASKEKRRLDLRMIILNTLGNNAIYIGLFGTVLGVIKAFHDLAHEVGAGPEVVMQGLSEALLATAAGLLVAIPCVIAFNAYQKQIKDILAETDSMAGILASELKTAERPS
ncbi:MAG: hypothetical protein A2902_07350 [Elusimicrobia bacterium RIFCSPLOWO2_01_FULL_64_13]|nr:MAG: hypothetical protein A2902_07350 [Elusimicrobia bacterium RIFCSPLOWO2_01_FULL_64_13]